MNSSNAAIFQDTIYVHDTAIVRPCTAQINDLMDQLGEKYNETLYLKQEIQNAKERSNDYLITLIIISCMLFVFFIYTLKKHTG